MIKVDNIVKEFDNKQVLKGITAEFDSGKTNLIIGQSGSGKTVLLKSIIGLIKPDAGEIFYGDRSISQMSKLDFVELRKEIGMLFQGSALFDSMTIGENVLYPLEMFSSMDKNKKIERALYCLERVALKDSFNLYPSEVSGGMQKRAAIARAIALNPKYLFCDEPNSGLDPVTSIKIDLLISDITKEFGITTVVNTHDMNSVLTIGEKIIYIYKGNKEWEGNNKEILESDNKRLNDFVFASKLVSKD